MHLQPTEAARLAVETMMRRYEAPLLPPVGRFHYHQGVFLSGVCQTYLLTGDERIHEINPDAVVHTYKTFYAPQTAEQFDFTRYDYVVDAIDTVTGKLELAEQAQKTETPIISSMGAGNKMDAAAFEVTDIYKTSVCPLAHVMRRELKKRGVRTLKVVYSKEPPMTPLDDISISCRTHCICPPGTARKCTQRRQVPGSNAFVPSVVGLILAGEVVKDLIRADEPAGSGDFRPQPLSTGENA